MIHFSVPLQQIDTEFIMSHNIRLFVYRLDQSHPHISGNKMFKLHYNLNDAKEKNKATILTFGGAFSNHIAATAAAAKESGIHAIGIIRGEGYPELNATLKFARSCGMELHYVSRALYRDKKELYEYVEKEFGERGYYLIPEGGANELGVLGCKEIIKNIPIDFDVICCPCGTGTTLSGMILSIKQHQHALGFQVLKARDYMHNEVLSWLEHFRSGQHNWSINEDHHFGGYAKSTPELTEFIRQFEKENGIPLDPIYTGKMIFGLYDMIQKGEFKKGQTIIAVHTGGLQGIAGAYN